MRTKLAGIWVPVVMLGLCASWASADVATLQAVDDRAVESAFTLHFSDFGLTTSSRVISTNFRLAIDEAAGTARFVSYEQDVEPLILPGPTPDGVNTGDLHVRIVPGSSSGTYNKATETFTTSDQYEISFTGDLSAFGLTSPVTLPSSTVGSLKGGTARATQIQMNWSGVGQLANPAAPGQPMNFNYVCEVNTVIDRGPVAALGQFFANVCGLGAATMMPFGLLGLWMMKLRFGRRRG